MDNSYKYKDNELNLKKAVNGDESAVETLIKNNYPLVTAIAKRFTGRGCDTEDLIQIGLIGMLKAIRSFDVSRGNVFSTYAVPMITGEIKKFLRDDGLIKVGRVRKQNGYAVMRAKERFSADTGREPRISDISEITGLTAEEIADALEAIAPVSSLSATIGESEELTVENTSSVSESPFEKEIEKMALYESLNKLSSLWKKIVLLRYFKGLSQQETANKLGLTQVKISREEKKIFNFLRNELKE
ncbi:MAG: sigma-70 family RNA polymerase sigma factor [Clostridia bacterium]|nr:sigma-70 family RNA polymerase sigma factor [Clostridia bacterium]